MHVTSDRPRVGILGIMQELYDEMIPRITEHQASFAEQLVERCSSVAETLFTRPARNREDIERTVRELQNAGVDGIMIVMLTYGPALRTVRSLLENPLPVLLANIQPEPVVTEAWDMTDLTYNQGIHGAQDQAHALLRAGVPYSVLTEDWQSDAFLVGFGNWARAARTVTALKRTTIGLFGYPMNDMEDVLYDPAALTRVLGPTVANHALGELVAAVESAAEDRVGAMVAEQRQRFAVDPQLSAESHAYAVRLELGLRDVLDAHGERGFSFHFEPFGRDGRFRQLPLLAASDLMADGYGFGAEGDTNAAALMCASHVLAGDAHFSEMYAMDFALDSVLVSHMGEGNWKVARGDRPVRLIDRPLGIGGLANPPTAVFSAEPGPATTASLVPLRGDRYRLAVGFGEVLDTPVLPKVEMPYFHFRPENGVRCFLDGWLREGGTHHFCLNLGDQTERWRLVAELLGIEFTRV